VTRGHPGLGDQGSSFLKDQMLIFLSPTAVAGEVFIGLFMDRLQSRCEQDSARPNSATRAEAADLIWDARSIQVVSTRLALAVSTSRMPGCPPPPALASMGRGGDRRRRPVTVSPKNKKLCFIPLLQTGTVTHPQVYTV
jgi:hypothetical protein